MKCSYVLAYREPPLAIHAFPMHWAHEPPTNGQPAAMTVCGLKGTHGDTAGRGHPKPTWLAMRQVTCGLCRRVLLAEMKRGRR